MIVEPLWKLNQRLGRWLIMVIVLLFFCCNNGSHLF